MAPSRCTVESLEARSLCSASLPYTAVVPAELKQFVGHADEGVSLPNGKFFVLGSVSQGKTFRNVYVMYNADGTLDTGFNHSGYAIQSTARSTQFGLAEMPYALPDGTVLIQFEAGLRRLSAKGDFDTNYGTGGLLKVDLYSMHPQADGTLLGYSALPGYTKRFRFDRHGTMIDQARTADAGEPVAGSTSGENAAWGATWTGSRWLLNLTVLNADGTMRKGFAGNGKLTITTIEDAWLKQHGPWYDSDGNPVARPDTQSNSVTAAADGGYVIETAFFATHTKPTTSVPFWSTESYIRIHVSATGVVESINAPSDGRLAAAFRPAAYGTSDAFSGTFHYGSGADRTFTLPGVNGEVYNSTRATNGDYFLMGGSSEDPQLPWHFTVVRVAASAKVSGTLFNDRDRDGKYNSGETVNVGRTVFLDANRNGKPDVGEDVTCTDARGRYTFGDVAPGQYAVRRVLPGGFKMTTPPTTITLSGGDDTRLDLGSVQAVV